MENYFIIEKRDLNKIKFLESLNNISTFWDDVRKKTKTTTSDHALNRWQCLAETRYNNIKFIKEN